jgi:hypothetical protein
MTPAARIVLLCARVRLAPAQRDELSLLLSGPVDWDELCSLTDRHGLAPILCGHLEAHAAIVPRDVLVSLWSRRGQVARRNGSMARELADVLGLLEQNGIPALPYKGPTLALVAYGDLGLREFGDLDILVRPSDARRAKEALENRGYVPQFCLAPQLEESLVRSRRHYEWPLAERARGMLVELHWRADPDHAVFELEDANWWDGLPSVDLPGRRVRVLGAEDLLLVLCLHGSKHFWFSLGWLVDVAELVRTSEDLNWDRFLARATQRRCAKKVALGLLLAERWLQAPLPPGVRDFVAQCEMQQIANWIGRGLLQRSAPQLGVLEWERHRLATHDSMLRGIGHFARALFTPGLGEWLRWPLPRALHFLYWPLRLGRLAAKYLPMSAVPPESARPRPASR